MTAAAVESPVRVTLPDGTTVWKFSREQFRTERWDYSPGEHVVFAGPTQRGKTTLAFALLEPIVSEVLPAYVAVSKPKDPVTSREGQRLKFKLVRDWPPTGRRMRELFDKPTGYLIWPQFGDVNEDTYQAARITAALIQERYRAGMKDEHGILVMDDTMVKSKILGLDQEMTTILAMSGAMGLGGWFFVQKPTDSGRAAIWSYGASEHVFLFRDPDRRNRQRYDEIGGVDPHLVEQTTLKLSPYECVYIKRTGEHMCIVGDK